LIFLLMIVGLGGCIAWGLYSFYKLTSPAPVAIPRVTPGPGDYERLERRIEDFAGAEAEAKEQGAEVVLSAEELNTLIAGNPNPKVRKLVGAVYLRLEGDRVYLDVSLPFKATEIPVLEDRYLNATFEAKLALAEGKLKVEVVSGRTAEGREVPREFMNTVDRESLNRSNPRELEKFVAGVKSLEVKDGRLVLRR
jgi:hypothetical protein